MLTGAADLVLRNGRVLTLDDRFTVSEAIAVRGDVIVAVGSEEVAGLAGPDTRVVDLAGGTVLPGINDAHLHLALFGDTLRPDCLDLTGVASVEQLLAAVAEADRTLPGDAWLFGQGWREAAIAEFAAGVLSPHRSVLDAVARDRPVLLRHASAHAAWANTAALARAGLTARTPDPEGGRIVRDADGEPTGLLLESAGELVARCLPPRTSAERQQAITDGMRTLNSLGVTSVTDPIVWPELLRDYTALRRRDELTVRVNALMHWDWPSPTSSPDGLATALSVSGLSAGLGDDWLRVGGVKLFADGVPSHRTAWLHDPYPEGGCGSLVTPGDDDAERAESLRELVGLAHRNRLQVQIHVTGDRAADAAVEALTAALEEDPWPRARHALIHGTLLAPGSYARLAAHGIGVVTSSLMRRSSGVSITAAVGATRWSRAFPAAELLAHGVPVADSSDAPVTFPDWRRGLATFLGAAEDELGRVPEDLRLSREQGIRLWTTGGAHFEHAERRKGTLAPGMLADLVVLDGDLLTAEPGEIESLCPVLTVVGGRIVHEVTR